MDGLTARDLFGTYMKSYNRIDDHCQIFSCGKVGDGPGGFPNIETEAGGFLKAQ
jgi:hypothetical protein